MNQEDSRSQVEAISPALQCIVFFMVLGCYLAQGCRFHMASGGRWWPCFGLSWEFVPRKRDWCGCIKSVSHTDIFGLDTTLSDSLSLSLSFVLYPIVSVRLLWHCGPGLSSTGTGYKGLWSVGAPNFEPRSMADIRWSHVNVMNVMNHCADLCSLDFVKRGAVWIDQLSREWDL